MLVWKGEGQEYFQMHQGLFVGRWWWCDHQGNSYCRVLGGEKEHLVSLAINCTCENVHTQISHTYSFVCTVSEWNPLSFIPRPQMAFPQVFTFNFLGSGVLIYICDCSSLHFHAMEALERCWSVSLSHLSRVLVWTKPIKM